MSKTKKAFSSTSSSVPCNISVGKAAEGRSGKRATSNSGGCNQKYRTPPNASSTARSATALNVGSGCCSSKRGRWCRLPTRQGGALFRGGAGGLGDRLLRLRSRRLRGRRGGRGLGGAGLHGAHPRLTQEGIPLLLCAVEGVLIDVAADARDPAVGLILPEMPGARAVLHGRMVFGRAHPDRIVRQRAVGKIRFVEINGRIDDRPLAVMALHLLQHDLHVGDGLVLGDMAAAGR